MKVKVNLGINWTKFFIGLTYFLVIVVLTMTLRGSMGNPTITELNTPYWTKGGAFELSPERGRMALIYSLVEYKSFKFPLDVARFAVPDLGYLNGNYVSLFAPGLSFIAIPGYVIGKYLGASQLGAFALVAFFAFLNTVLIYKVGKSIGTNAYASLISAVVFLFATPAFSYSVTLYQHHISTFLILASIYLLIRYNSIWSLSLVWILCGFSVSVDYPNFFMMLPIGIAALGQMYKTKYQDNILNLQLKTFNILSIIAVTLPMMFFFWVNKETYDNPLQLAGSATQVKGIDENGQPSETNFTVGLNDSTVELSKTARESKDTVRNPVTFFKTRNILNGLYILLVSPDRGILYFTPVILLGVIGMIKMYKEQNSHTVLLVAVLVMNLTLYAMWGDPWGGWAFGARYMIPSYAILAIFIGYLLTKSKNILLLIVTTLLFGYSVFVNTAGALTTNAIPPKVEVLELERLSGVEQKYNFKRNLDLINKNNYTSSFIYKTLVHDRFSVQKYFYSIVKLIGTLYLLLLINLFLKHEKALK